MALVLLGGMMITATVIGLGILALAAPNFDVELITIILIALFIIGASLMFVSFIIIIRETLPYDILKVSVIGLPRAGKTVFTTVFLHDFVNELKSSDTNETKALVEGFSKGSYRRVNSNYRKMNDLGKKPRTPTHKLDPMSYQSVLKVKRRGQDDPIRYTLTISDHAGETFQAMVRDVQKAKLPVLTQLRMKLSISARRFYKDVINSHILFLAVDLDAILSPAQHSYKPKDIASAFVDTIEYKLNPTGKLGAKKASAFPIALLFLKKDLCYVSTRAENDVLSEFSTLFRRCRANSLPISHYFVTSTGHEIDNLADPYVSISSENVFKPFMWALEHYFEPTSN